MKLYELEKYKINQSVNVRYESAGGTEKIHATGKLKDIGKEIYETAGGKIKYVWVSVWLPMDRKTSVFPSWCIH